MTTLYKCINGVIHYWESWDDEDGAIVHFGRLGEMGEIKKIKSSIFFNSNKRIQSEKEKMRKCGYKEIPHDEYLPLIIEYKVENMGTSEDIEKRHSLEDRMQETLGWTGLGFCDGGSIGSGTMEVCCYVVDFEIAKRVIERDLKETEFKDYLRIYNEYTE